MSKFVLDASAILALLNQEPGAEEVAAVLDQASVSAINLSEVAVRLSDRGLSLPEVRQTLAMLALPVVAFDEGLALGSAELRPLTRKLGLSLGDRACLATAASLDACAITADRTWSRLRLPVEIRCIR